MRGRNGCSRREVALGGQVGASLRSAHADEIKFHVAPILIREILTPRENLDFLLTCNLGMS